MQTTDQIDSMMEERLETDAFFNYAAIAYNHAMFLTESRKGHYDKIEACIEMVSKCIDKLVELSGTADMNNVEFLSAVNHTAKVAEIFKELEEMKGYKAVADGFKARADVIRTDMPKYTLTHLEALVNARRFNKRLSKNLSFFFKELLNEYVHSVGDFWNLFPECKTLAGQLRKLWIQCMSLRAYNYDPNVSYTQKELSAVMPNVLQSEDAEVHYLLCRLIYDCKIDCVIIKDYDAILNRLIDNSKDEANILLLTAAKLLNSLNEEMTARFDKMIKAAEQEEKPYDLEAAMKLRPEWGHLVIEYLEVKDKGVSLSDFCQQNRLPYSEFSRFYTAMVADVERAAQEDPFLRKLTRLPAKDQDEYAALMKRRTKVMKQVCDAVSGITGEKVEIKDLFREDGKVSKELDRKMNAAFKRFKKTDPRYMADFVFSMHELAAIEKEIDAFLTKRGL